MKLGVCYYPEHWPAERWATDAQLMRSAGLSVVRIGEFAWQPMEPAEGHFDWDWLDRAIDTLAAEGLKVVLGTPTAAPPAWLCKAYPDILPVDSQGRRRQFGSRHHYCYNSPTYHRHTARIVPALADRYGQHPAVIGWQIDNELGGHQTARCGCEACAAAFRAWLRAKYQTLAALNAAWGTEFWSQGYGDWGEIGLPLLTVTVANPSQVLDYYRFASDAVVAYQQMQIDLVRPRSPGRFITTNFMGNMPDVDAQALARPLDFVAWDSYPSAYGEVAVDDFYEATASDAPLAYDLGDPYVTGFCHDLMRGLKQAPFWIMEQQAGHVNWAEYNAGIRPGAVRLWTWHAVAAGAEAVLYFRWRAGLAGQEQFHSGLLHHDASPDQGYREVAALRAEQSLMEKVSQAPFVAQVALLMSYPDLWALELQPHQKDFTYWRHLFVYYRALQRMGIPADVVSAEADLGRYKLIVAPTAFLASEALVARLTDYVKGGGSALLGARSGFKTPTNLVTSQPLPGLFRPLIGATVTDWHALPPEAGFDFESSIDNLMGPATLWAEALAVEPGSGARMLGRYTAGPFAGRALITERPVGAGRALYAGWHPTEAQALALIARLTAQQGITSLVEALPAGGLAMQRGPYTLLFNFSDQNLPVKFRGQFIIVSPRDVKVLP
jgi:beta-galactosidase